MAKILQGLRTINSLLDTAIEKQRQLGPIGSAGPGVGNLPQQVAILSDEVKRLRGQMARPEEPDVLMTPELG